jgi:hypothetical protein
MKKITTIAAAFALVTMMASSAMAQAGPTAQSTVTVNVNVEAWVQVMFHTSPQSINIIDGGSPYSAVVTVIVHHNGGFDHDLNDGPVSIPANDSSGNPPLDGTVAVTTGPGSMTGETFVDVTVEVLQTPGNYAAPGSYQYEETITFTAN